MNNRLPPAGQTYLPKADQWLGPLGARLVIELPGVSREGLKLEFSPGRLVVLGQVRRRPQGQAQEEYPQGDFYRVFSLSPQLDLAQAQASLEEGILELRIPRKAAMQNNPKQVA